MSHWFARSPPSDFFDETLAYEESAQEFFDVTLAYEESAQEFSDVTLAQEDDRPGVPDQTEAASFHIRLISTT